MARTEENRFNELMFEIKERDWNLIVDALERIPVGHVCVVSEIESVNPTLARKCLSGYRSELTQALGKERGYYAFRIEEEGNLYRLKVKRNEHRAEKLGDF